MSLRNRIQFESCFEKKPKIKRITCHRMAGNKNFHWEKIKFYKYQLVSQIDGAILFENQNLEVVKKFAENTKLS